MSSRACHSFLFVFVFGDDSHQRDARHSHHCEDRRDAESVSHECMYVCMYLCMYVCMYVYMSVCLFVCLYVRMYVCLCVCMFVCVPVVVCLLFGVVSVCGAFVCTLSQSAVWRKVAAATPTPKGRQCAHHPHSFLFRPPRASIARGPEQALSPRISLSQHRVSSLCQVECSRPFLPVMFTRVSSEEFLSLILLRDNAPSSEFLHRLVHLKLSYYV